jgi:hypothetical protein
LLMAVIRVLEFNPHADCSQLGLVAYAATPCQQCRSNAAEVLQCSRVAPAWLTEECLFDSHTPTRELVRNEKSETNGDPERP